MDTLPDLDCVFRLDKKLWSHGQAAPHKKKGNTAANSKVPPSQYASYVYCVQFYPYAAPGVDPVFAVAQWNRVIVCRPKSGGVDILLDFYDENSNSSLLALAWSQDPETGDPLLCVSGEDPKIKILNVTKGEFVRSLSGHGKEVNDLAVSPTDPTILASCSMDRSIRIWSLDRKHEKSPTCAILHGLHSITDGLMTIAWHDNGRYLASGGYDTIFNIWVTPELPDQRTGTDKVHEVHYPHFSSTEMHAKYIDCVRFYGDLIFTIESRIDDENCIVLWRIEDLDSQQPIPTREQAPVPPPASTLSSATTFTRSWSNGRFQRILSFRLPYAPYSGRRFSVFRTAGYHPVLAIGILSKPGQPAQLLFWDLQRLEEELGTTLRVGPFAPVPAHKAIALDGTNNGRPTTAKVQVSKLSMLKEDLFKFHQADWSPGGEYCVFTSDNGYICITRRRVRGM